MAKGENGGEAIEAAMTPLLVALRELLPGSSRATLVLDAVQQLGGRAIKLGFLRDYMRLLAAEGEPQHALFVHASEQVLRNAAQSGQHSAVIHADWQGLIEEVRGWEYQAKVDNFGEDVARYMDPNLVIAGTNPPYAPIQTLP